MCEIILFQSRHELAFLSPQVKKELIPSVITPLKTPPAHFFPTFSHVYPILDESANLSPAKPHKTSALTHSISSTFKQEGNSLGFMAASISHPPPTEPASHPQEITALAVATAAKALDGFLSDSNLSDSSGEESDSESSDTEDKDTSHQPAAHSSTGGKMLGLESGDVSHPQHDESAWERKNVKDNLFSMSCFGQSQMETDRDSAPMKLYGAKECDEHSGNSGI